MSHDVLATHGPLRLFQQVQSLIGADLAESEQIFDRELASWQPFVAELLEHLGRYRGKRLRPILLLLAAQACGGIEPEHRVLAAVVEMIHTATLVHDDVLDEAATRRHVPTVNARWSNESSVLLGDYLFTHAFHLASSLETTQACRLIGRATNLVCEGELAQIHERGNLALSEEQYLEIIEGKTAELCALCGRLGALYAGASPAIADDLESYGRALGVAFQIADDLLDVMGNEQQVGKTLGSDLALQKLTLPVIHLLAQTPPGEQAALRALLQNPDPESRRLLQARTLRSGSVDYARARAEEYAQFARRRLTALPESPARGMLEDLTEFAVRRTH